MMRDLRLTCTRCHWFEPITGKTFCALCALAMLAVAQQDQKLARVNYEVVVVSLCRKCGGPTYPQPPEDGLCPCCISNMAGGPG